MKLLTALGTFSWTTCAIVVTVLCKIIGVFIVVSTELALEFTFRVCFRFILALFFLGWFLLIVYIDFLEVFVHLVLYILSEDHVAEDIFFLTIALSKFRDLLLNH